MQIIIMKLICFLYVIYKRTAEEIFGYRTAR